MEQSINADERSSPPELFTLIMRALLHITCCAVSLGSGLIPTVCASLLLVMAPGAGYLLRKLQLLKESDAGTANVQVQVLAAQTDMLAELTLAEIKGADCEFDVPGLAIIWNEVRLVKEVASAVRNGAPIPHVELPVQGDASAPPVSTLTTSQKQTAKQLEKEGRQGLVASTAWIEEVQVLQACGYIVGISHELGSASRLE